MKMASKVILSSFGQLIAFSLVSSFEVRLPASDESLQLVICIRDQRDCATEWNNLSSISVRMDSNSFVQWLTIGNQNRVGQVIISLAQHLNQMDQDNVNTAISSRSILPCFYPFDLHS
jgi:hypothetical protein